MDRGAVGIDGDGDGHVFHFEFVDGFHAEVGECDDAAGLDGFGHQIRGAADGHEVGALIFLDDLDRFGAALGLADHGDEAGLAEHELGELVHARRGRWACGTDDFVVHRIDGADVIDHAIGEIESFGQRLARFDQCLQSFVSGVASGEHLAVQQQALAGLPGCDFCRGQRVEIHARCVRGGLEGELRPQVEIRRVELHRTRAIEHEVRVTRGGAVRNDGDR